PSGAAARLEGSKAFAKDVMLASGAPTGAWVQTSDVDEAHAALEQFGGPYVVKADGLAAGKGVTVTEDIEVARAAIRESLVDRRFGDAGASIVIEEFLSGPERSVFGVCDGEDVVLLAPAQDYKRAKDGDEGPNTGGMGAYLPVPGFGLGDVDHLRDLVFLPVLREMAKRGAPFRGLLYAGIVDTAAGPKLLEFNARFGDPETQVILPALASDLADLLYASAVGSPGGGGVADVDVAWHDDAFVTVVLASEGYPGDYPKGKAITGVDRAEAQDGVEAVFHAGTIINDDKSLVTNGGRVLNVVGRGATVADARTAAYDGARKISWWGVQTRTDIAAGIE
ncbi:MAG: phosphoribosylamine--glycine ligase, partial [Glaciecola sp.]